MTFTVELGETEYRIVGPDGEEGPNADYGEPAVLAIGGAVYYCQIEDPNTDTAVVMQVQSVRAMKTETDEVEFEDDEKDGDGPIVVEAEEEDNAPKLVE